MESLEFFGWAVVTLVAGAIALGLAIAIKRILEDRRVERMQRRLQRKLRTVPIQGPASSRSPPSED